MSWLQILGNDKKYRSLPSARGLAEHRIEQRAELLDALEFCALFRDRLKKPDMLHPMKRGIRAFRGSGGIDVRGNYKQRNGFFMSLCDGRGDICCATAGGDQTNRRFLCRSCIAECHVPGAAFMLGIDEFHVR